MSIFSHSNDSAFSTNLLSANSKIYRKGGIYFDCNWKSVGVTEQFTTNSDVYHERYFDRQDFDTLIEYCLQLANIDKMAQMKVLDIGSGGGSSVFALDRALPRVQIVGTDISPELLTIQRNIAIEKNISEERLNILCFDLHEDFFAPESFDFIFGAAILHHLLYPAKALLNVSRALKPGGSLVLVEPLEAGSLLLCILFEKILLTVDHSDKRTHPVSNLMRAMRLDIQSRLGVPVLKPWSEHLDDKWVFDEPYLHTLAKDLDFSGVEIYPSSTDLETVYTDAFYSLLSDSGNKNAYVCPQINQVLFEFDRGFARELKQKLAPSGIIIFRK
jgi:2-polyprenyl-3-methyl-5-hydroxy-6-metoxy-1,4-benzoquinol methylase